MLWKLFQTLIVMAVLFTNIHFKLTPNPYLAGAIGLGIAWCVTRLIYLISDWREARRARRQIAPHSTGLSLLERERLTGPFEQ